MINDNDERLTIKDVRTLHYLVTIHGGIKNGKSCMYIWL